MDRCTVKISKGEEQLSFQVRKGLGFQALTIQKGCPLEFDCRAADCGICIVRVLKGSENLTPMKFREQDFLKAMAADPDERLACQTRIQGDVEIALEYS